MPSQRWVAIKREEKNKLFKSVFSYTTLSSTNDTAKALIQKDEVPEYFVVTSRRQTEGKGRWGRKWWSPSGGLWVSLVLPSGICETPSLRAAFSVVHTIRKLTPLTPGIRWPNDIMLGEKKVGGVLTENEFGKLIIGVGVNINQTKFPEELKDATSLRIELAKLKQNKSNKLNDINEPYLPIKKFFSEFIAHFEETLYTEGIVDKLREFLLLLGEKVKVKVKDGVKTGEFFDIGANGSLFLREPSGIITELTPSEVEFIR